MKKYIKTIWIISIFATIQIASAMDTEDLPGSYGIKDINVAIIKECPEVLRTMDYLDTISKNDKYELRLRLEAEDINNTIINYLYRLMTYADIDKHGVLRLIKVKHISKHNVWSRARSFCYLSRGILYQVGLYKRKY